MDATDAVAVIEMAGVQWAMQKHAVVDLGSPAWCVVGGRQSGFPRRPRCGSTRRSQRSLICSNGCASAGTTAVLTMFLTPDRSPDLSLG